MTPRETLVFLISTILVTQSLAAPSLVVSSTEPSNQESGKEENDVPDAALTTPQIYQMHIQSNVRNRFANTTVISKLRNLAQKPQEATFSVVLPETAFISGFVMEISGKNYTAYVKEKEEARRDYDRAVSSGLGAAHVAVSARDSNRFTVSVNVEPASKVAFYLLYEELLKRQDGRYEQVINIHPGQPVKDLSVEVYITESRKITDLKAPPLRSGNEIGNDNSDLDPRAILQIVNDKTAIVRFSPNLERQKQFAHLLGTNENEGLSGQFVIQYDVERDPQGGEVLIQDGYFVHFFAPSDLAPLPKHIVFVLDTSSSMYGEKIKQLKEAMYKILEDLHENDLFNLVEFNTNAKVWELNNKDASVWFPSREDDEYRYYNTEVDFRKYNFPSAYLATPDNIKKAKNTIAMFQDDALTDIYTALSVGLHLVALTKQKIVDNVERQPMIVFLTDGEPSIGLTSADEITERITDINTGERKSPIFTLSFGSGADRDFLQKLAIRNSGFAKHIYEAADAALQLQDFYRHVSAPLLSDVHFKYEPSVTSLTKTEFPIHFGGSELVICGRNAENELRLPVVDAIAATGKISLRPHTVERSASNIERLWAYLTIKQLLEKKEMADYDKEEIKKKALELALKYSFVTPVSSLVVVKPNATSAVNTEDASEVRLALDNSFISYPVHRSSGGSSLSGQGSVSFQANSGVNYADLILEDDYDGYDMHRIFGGFTKSLPADPLNSTPDYVPYVSRTDYASIIFTELLTTLPWLQDILNNNSTLSLPSGNYKLGSNETFSDNVACSNGPYHSIGHCSLLHSCPQMHSLLTDANSFAEHFCILRNETPRWDFPCKIIMTPSLHNIAKQQFQLYLSVLLSTAVILVKSDY